MIPEQAQPRSAELDFDLDQALGAVVKLRSQVPADAFTASVLGIEREGSGVVIDKSGLVLTIGYLTTEADQVWLITGAGAAVPGHPIAYDFVTGFGLVQALGRLDVPPIAIGSTADLAVGAPLILAAGGGREAALRARLVARREFAGYWEYLLDEALFTIPAHPSWGGAACIGADGRLVGIGSLLVQVRSSGDKTDNSNMIVPIDLLPPILDDLLTKGRADRPARPWLGIYPSDEDGGVVIAGLAPGGPAEQAGIEQGDRITEVDEVPTGDLSDVYREIWSLGDAGVEVPLTLLRDGRRLQVLVHSADRADFLKTPRLH